MPEPSPGTRSATEGIPVLAANAPRAPLREGVHAEATPEPPTTLLEDAPEGVPSEWRIWTFGEPQESPRTWLDDVFSRTIEGHWAADIPFNLRLCFGDSDRAWFARVQERFDADLTRLRARGLPIEEHMNSFSALRDSYRTVLGEVGYRRVQSNPVLRARFEDGRLLRDLPKEGPDARWLAAMIGEVSHVSLWSEHHGGPPEADKALLSARDLRLLKALSLEVGERYGRATSEQARHDAIRAVATRLTAFLSSRR